MALEQLDLFGLEPKATAAKSKSVVKQKVIAETKKQQATESKGKRGRKSNKEMYTLADLIGVPDDETLDKKLYYSISEVAAWFNVNQSQIRFWENEFDILQPRKNKKGDRLFRKEDIKNLQLIYYLLRNKKYSIEGAKEYLKANSKNVQLQQQLTTVLLNLKSFLLELKANLDS
jgi:DNA-binding transcriptional MerR regulator